MRLGQGADLGCFHLAVAEQHQGRDAANAVFRGRLGVGVNVQLAHLHTIRVFLGDFFQDGRDHFARATPLRPVIDEYGFVGAEDLLAPIGIGDVLNVLRHCGSP